MAFDIRKYLEDNKIELGKYETTESHNVAKGVSDIRKTQHEVHIVDGKFQLDTLKKVIVENKQLNEASGDISNIAEIFTRFLIGDRKAAIRELQSEMKTNFVPIEVSIDRPDIYNKKFSALTKKIKQSIKSEL
jgi:hypothetical protein